MPPATNPIDITTLAAVKTWAGVQGTNQDQEIQDCITSFSLYAMHRTARGNADGSVPATSPFVTLVSYDEFYDGNGNDHLPLNNWPIGPVSFVNDSGYAIPQSTSVTTPGWVVDQTKRFIVLRLGGSAYPQRFRGQGYGWAGVYRGGFSLGTQNIEVGYMAGFSAVPYDLEMMARKVVSLNYKRTQWIGQKQQAMAAGAGTVTFNDWEMDKQDTAVLNYYMARAA